MALLVSPDYLASALGLEPADGDLARWAVESVSSVVEAYCRLTVRQVTDDVAHLAGTSARRLTLGERPVTAVSSIDVDGTAATDYVWRRWGAIYRDLGWGGPEAEVVVTYSHGYDVVPDDLAAVVHTAAARLLVNPGQWASQREGAGHLDGRFRAALPPGFTVSELAVLNRYRRRTA